MEFMIRCHSEWRIYDSDDTLPLFPITGIDPSRSFKMTLNVLYKDYGVGRQKELAGVRSAIEDTRLS